jgi:hypothetical protein
MGPVHWVGVPPAHRRCYGQKLPATMVGRFFRPTVRHGRGTFLCRTLRRISIKHPKKSLTSHNRGLTCMSHVLIFSRLSFKLKFNLHRWFLFTFDTINLYVPFLIYFLPSFQLGRSPVWNPIYLVWRYLV